MNKYIINHKINKRNDKLIGTDIFAMKHYYERNYIEFQLQNSFINDDFKYSIFTYIHIFKDGLVKLITQGKDLYINEIDRVFMKKFFNIINFKLKRHTGMAVNILEGKKK